jgi:hypothetical protein
MVAMPIIPDTRGGDGRIMVGGQHRQKVNETLYQKIN